jgi:hypothetical protein
LNLFLIAVSVFPETFISAHHYTVPLKTYENNCNLIILIQYLKIPKETDYAISIVHLNEGGKPNTGGVLKPGDRITINGNMPKDATEFSINFCFKQDNCIFSDSTVEQAHPINANAKCLFEQKI